MAITPLLITNLSSGMLSLDIMLDSNRQIRNSLAPGQSVNVADIATADELNRNPQLQQLLRSNPPKVSVTEGAPSQDDIQALDQNRPQTARFTQLGGGPQVLTFAGLGLLNMADDQYSILLGGETINRTYPQQSSITPTGFTLLGGTTTDVHHITIVGKIA
jgi:hypothetical protein